LEGTSRTRCPRQGSKITAKLSKRAEAHESTRNEEDLVTEG